MYFFASIVYLWKSNIIYANFLFQPINTPKRPHDGDSDDEDDDYNKQRKMRKMAKARAVEIERAEKVRRMKEELERKLLEEANESSSGTGVTNEERERIQQMLEEAAANEVLVNLSYQ